MLAQKCVQQSEWRGEQHLLELMARAEVMLAKAGERFTVYSSRAEELEKRLKEERFHLAVLGQFKRGKSSLINALLNGEFLPTSSIPLTALPTVIRWGAKRRAVIVFEDGRKEENLADDDNSLGRYLAKYVVEQENPCNKLGVRQVEVEYPAKFLLGGVTLIDTPGIGSTFKHNTETTLQFLNQCDAALFVVSADPPITAGEVEFLQTVKGHVHKLFFVLNKADYLSLAEQEKVITFLKGVLCEQAGFPKNLHIYRLSARQALAAKQTGNESLLEESGLNKLEKDLLNFFAKEKKEVLAAAIEKKFLAVLKEAALDLSLNIRALEMPAAELADKQSLLAQKLAEIEEERRIAGDLLIGDKKRILKFLEEQAALLRDKAKAYFESIVNDRFAGGDGDIEQDVRHALSQEIPVFFEKELAEAADIFGDHIADILRPHRRRADSLVAAVRKAAADIFNIGYEAAEEEAVFQMKRQPYWVQDKWQTGFGGIPEGWLEKLLPAGLRRERIRKRLIQYVDELVTQNVENLRWALLQNAETAFRSFAEELKTKLAGAVDGTNKAISEAALMKTHHAEKVEAELIRLRALEDEIKRFFVK